ncbi:MAG: YncE family protein [Thermodesulfobacteriota bacterium]
MKKHSIFFLGFGLMAMVLSLCASQSFANLYVTNATSDNVSLIDTSTNVVTVTIAVGNHPFGIAMNPAGNRAYITNSLDNTVSVIDTGSNTVSTIVIVGSVPPLSDMGFRSRTRA